MLAKKKLDYTYPSQDDFREQKQPKTAKRKVKKLKKKQAFRLNKETKIIASIALTFMLAVTVLYSHTSVAALKMDISKLEGEKIELENQKEYLLANLEEIKSTSDIEEKAMVSLGMDYPKEGQVVYIDLEDKTSEKVATSKNPIKMIVSSVLGLF